jgi:hypothetical protein
VQRSATAPCSYFKCSQPGCAAKKQARRRVAHKPTNAARAAQLPTSLRVPLTRARP